MPRCVLACLLAVCAGCAARRTTFAEDLAVLRRHTDVVLLRDRSGERLVAVVPAYQGRVMTSSFAGLEGPSLGWVNRPSIAAGRRRAHRNPVGGEERLWLGPEAGPFGFFFAPGSPFDFAHWQTPPLLDREPFSVTARSSVHLVCRKEGALTNYARTRFRFTLEREVRLLEPPEVEELLGLALSPEVRWVAYESRNRITNRNTFRWTRKTGMPSLWLLSMLPPTPRTVIVLPVRPGDAEDLGAPVRVYASFGPVPRDRLRKTSRAVFFRGDGRRRGKIGVGPRRARPVLGSFSPEWELLTLVFFNLPAGETCYVNSTWGLQEDPFAGDVVNASNDGPVRPDGGPLGLFYELETSSPAAALAPGATLEHRRRTIHLTAPRPLLDEIARRTLGVTATAAARALP